MPTYVCQGSFTADEFAGLLKSPKERTEAANKVATRMGAKLLCYYITQGQHDFLLVLEAPNSMTAGVFGAAVAGGPQGLEIAEAMQPYEALQGFSKANAVVEAFTAAA